MNGYYLIDIRDNQIVAKIELNLNEIENPYKSFLGKVYECYAWDINGVPLEYSFHSEVDISSTGCSHWWFHGEDYEKNNEQDSYYHLCDMPDVFITIMCFVWKAAKEYYLKRDVETKEDSYDKEISKKCIEENFDSALKKFDFLLNNYQIVEGL